MDRKGKGVGLGLSTGRSGSSKNFLLRPASPLSLVDCPPPYIPRSLRLHAATSSVHKKLRCLLACAPARAFPSRANKLLGTNTTQPQQGTSVTRVRNSTEYGVMSNNQGPDRAMSTAHYATNLGACRPSPTAACCGYGAFFCIVFNKALDHEDEYPR